MSKVISLNGSWKFKTDPEGMGDLYPDSVVQTYQRDCKFFDPSYDDGDWNEIVVPSCWQVQGYNYNGVAWYRLRFDYQPSQEFNVVRLKFKGVDYFADVWLNGYYLGSHEGFFNHFKFDITKWIKKGENLLVVRVDSPNDTNVKVRPYEKTLIKGALQDWDVNNLRVNPGGIWNDVKLLLSKDIYIDGMKVTSFLDSEKVSAKVLCKFKVFNTTDKIKKIDLEAILLPHNFSGEISSKKMREYLAPGLSEKDIWIDLKNPKLWWPWDMGEQNLYKVILKVSENSQVLDELSDRIGLRNLEKEKGNWVSYLNGKRIFYRGTNYLSDQLLSNMTREKYEVDVQLMKEANMNAVRLFCVVEKEEFYDLCDEKGILIYQDFPIQWRMSNSSDLVRRAVTQARDMVNQLYNHPSIIIWCYGSEPGIKNFEKLGMALATASIEEDPYRFVQQGNSVWEWRIAKEKYDWPIDYHFYCGWYPTKVNSIFSSQSKSPTGNSMEALEIKDRQLLEFVTEYGSQSLPELNSLKKFIPNKDLWPPNWSIYKRHCLQEDILMRWIGKPKSLEEMIENSQDYQAFQLKYHTEFYRRHKFNPCNGALQFVFNDCWPAITWSVIDYYRRKKKGYYALKQAFNPIHIMMDWPEIKGEKAGMDFSKKLYVVNDYDRGYTSLEVKWEIQDSSNRLLESKTIACSVAKNSLKEVGEVCWKIPPQASENYKIKFELWESTKLLSSNEYIIKVHPS